MRRMQQALAATIATTTVLLGAQAAGALNVPNFLDPKEPTQAEPDAEINVTGQPFRGVNDDGTVNGIVDAHTHLNSNVGFGGNIVCGDVFSPKGVKEALQDCPGHGSSLLENVMNSANGGNIFKKHDETGWPTFNDWPTATSMTHQSMYYRWVERAWRGGQRIMVNHLVNNAVLCTLPLQKNRYNCDDMETIRRQAKQTKDLERFIDAKYGDPAEKKGWFRIVDSASEARKVVAEGKLAVIMGVEISGPFGCTLDRGRPMCDERDIDRGLDELHDMGVRTVFLCHKLDNALCGVRFDEGATGAVVNFGNFLQTGEWWDVRRCDGELHDNTVIGGVVADDATRFWRGGKHFPVYPKGPHCNAKGMSPLGDYALRGLMKRNMMVELDHQSVKAASHTMQVLEEAKYPGVISSHSWMDKHFTERIYKLGGFIATYGGDTKKMVKELQDSKALREKYGKSSAFGIDSNGFGSQPMPRGEEAAKEGNAVEYPFDTPDGGSSVEKQRTGEREFDFNKDGFAHYGMMPDYVKDLENVGGKTVVNDLMRGAETYLQTVEAMEGYRYNPAKNLAAGKRASSSSDQFSFNGEFSAKRAVDGKLPSRWSSQHTMWGETQWLQVDLGTKTDVEAVRIDWERAYGSDYDVQVSDDGKTWRTVERVIGADGDVDVVKIPGTSTRFVRIEMHKRGSQWNNYSIRELSVF